MPGNTTETLHALEAGPQAVRRCMWAQHDFTAVAFGASHKRATTRFGLACFNAALSATQPHTLHLSLCSDGSPERSHILSDSVVFPAGSVGHEASCKVMSMQEFMQQMDPDTGTLGRNKSQALKTTRAGPVQHTRHGRCGSGTARRRREAG